jgi:hypothetical protein
MAAMPKKLRRGVPLVVSLLRSPIYSSIACLRTLLRGGAMPVFPFGEKAAHAPARNSIGHHNIVAGKTIRAFHPSFGQTVQGPKLDIQAPSRKVGFHLT